MAVRKSTLIRKKLCFTTFFNIFLSYFFNLKKRYRAFSHREKPTFKIWQRMRFVVVIRSYSKGHKKI
jgi:hypothetical protein